MYLFRCSFWMVNFLLCGYQRTKKKNWWNKKPKDNYVIFFFQDAWWLDCILSIIFFYAVFFKELLNVEVLKCCRTVKQFKVKINSRFPRLPDFLIFGFSIHAYHEISVIVSWNNCVLGKVCVPFILCAIFFDLASKIVGRIYIKPNQLKWSKNRYILRLE